ncbi:MAG: hypothetical protein HPY44_10765 [Armatimonadetes bacterium]|nr:hypothetical protein [Armatimonadota bacterium]
MTHLTRSGLALGTITLLVVLGGCSGSGQPVQEVTGQSYKSLATDHLSAVVTVRSWFNIMHQKLGVGAAQGGCTPTYFEEQLPDGSTHAWGTTSDCIQYDYVLRPDESGSGTHTRPDGSQTQLQWTTPVWEGDKVTYHTTETLWTGGTLDYDFSIDFSVPTSLQSWDGYAQLPNTQRMQFRVVRTQEVDDKLWVTLPDGAMLYVTVPTAPADGTSYWPVFSSGATGTYTGPSGRTLDFTILGDDASERWQKWVFQGSDGSSGSFNLGADLLGSGTLTDGTQVIGALNWQAGAMTGILDLLAADTTEVTPSAAARDFQIDRWITNMAAMGPAPMY